jgi:hypothetical protein
VTDAIERAARRTEMEHRRRRQHHWVRFNQKAFHIHLTVFVAVQLLLVAVWALQWQLGGTAYPWFLFALAGWGVGLAIHYAVVRDKLGRDAATPSTGMQDDSGRS